MKNHHGGVILLNGYLYGFNDSILTCLEFATGKMMWRDRSVGKGSVMFADGHLYLQGENNIVGLAEASPSGYKEKGRFTIADKGLPSWAHPVVSGAGSTCATRTHSRSTTSRRSRRVQFAVRLRSFQFGVRSRKPVSRSAGTGSG